MVANEKASKNSFLASIANFQGSQYKQINLSFVHASWLWYPWHVQLAEGSQRNLSPRGEFSCRIGKKIAADRQRVHDASHLRHHTSILQASSRCGALLLLEPGCSRDLKMRAFEIMCCESPALWCHLRCTKAGNADCCLLVYLLIVCCLIYWNLNINNLAKGLELQGTACKVLGKFAT